MRYTLVTLVCGTLLVSFATLSEAADESAVGSIEPPPVIAATPAKLTLKLDGNRPVNDSIRLFNMSEKPIVVSTTVNNWDLDKKNQVRNIPPTPQSLDQWIIINPINFTIPPGESQTVRLSVRPRAKPEPGEHRGIIYFDQKLPKDDGNKTIRVKFRLGVILYGLAEKIVRQGVLHGIKMELADERASAIFDIGSVGNSNIRMEGQYTLWRKADFPKSGEAPMYNLLGVEKNVPSSVLLAAKLPNTPVLAGERRFIRAEASLPKEAGYYILFVRGKLGDKPFRKIFPITVSE